MKLTPLDIHHKEFRRAIRGYNEEEVDVFLDQVADEFERLFKENIDLKEQVEKMQDKVKQYEGIEQTIQKALLTAQQAADEVQATAKKESELIIKDAEIKAKEIIQKTLSQKQEMQGDLNVLKDAEREFRQKFKDLLETYLSLIGKVERGEKPGEKPEPPAAEEKRAEEAEAKEAQAEAKEGVRQEAEEIRVNIPESPKKVEAEAVVSESSAPEDVPAQEGKKEEKAEANSPGENFSSWYKEAEAEAPKLEETVEFKLPPPEPAFDSGVFEKPLDEEAPEFMDRPDQFSEENKNEVEEKVSSFFEDDLGADEEESKENQPQDSGKNSDLDIEEIS